MTPLNTDSLSEQTYQIIRNWIVTLHMRSGERIHIPTLQEYFGVSRAPIRDALHRLQAEKLVEVRPRVGYFVRRLTMVEIHDVWSARELFELYALNTGFLSIPHAEIAQLREESAAIGDRNVFDAATITRLDEIDATFHHTILINNCGNEYVISFYNSVCDLISLTRHLHARYRDDIIEHLAIFDSILEGEQQSAARSLAAHLQAVERDLLDNYS